MSQAFIADCEKAEVMVQMGQLRPSGSKKNGDMAHIGRLAVFVCKKAEDMIRIGKLAMAVCKKAADMTREKPMHFNDPLYGNRIFDVDS